MSPSEPLRLISQKISKKRLKAKEPLGIKIDIPLKLGMS
jgi:hypothetical protein